MRRISLRSLRSLVLLPALSLPAAAAQPGDNAERFESAMASGQLWEALSLCEQDVETAPRDADAWIRLGSALLALGKDPQSSGGNPGHLFADAAGAFDKALELEPGRSDVAPLAYEAHIACSEFAPAIDIATREVGAGLLATGQPSPVWLERVLRAERYRFFAQPPSEPNAYASALERLDVRFENARRARPEHAALHREHAHLLAGVGLQRRATAALRSGLLAVPSDVDMHRQLIDLLAGAGATDELPPIYADLAQAAPDEGLVWWYRSWIGITLGESQRNERRWGLAEQELAAAAEWARIAAERTPEHADGANRLRHRAQLGMAFCALGEGQNDTARERLIELLSASPELRDEKDGLGRSAIDAVGILGARYVDMHDYGAGAQLMQLVAELLPDDASWWNNLAYMQREHGTWLQGNGEPGSTEAAHEAFRGSWEAYLRAVELEPDNVRHLNDAALIQIYHLHDDLARAEEMLLRAVDLGQAQIDALGPDPVEAERYPLALAQGDALENLGYLYYHVTPDHDKALAFLERSLATDSGARPPVAARLAALRGETDPVEEQERRGPAPVRSVPPLRIAWEVSFDGASARATHEERPVFVYYRGQSLTGIDGEFWYKLLREQGMARALTATVPVVADHARHTTVERRSDGTRVACPRFGAITCADHVRAAEEFERFFAEHNEGRAAGADDEGYYLLGADGESLELNMALFKQLFDKDVEVTEPIAVDLASPRPGVDPRQRRAELLAAAESGDTEVVREIAAATTAADRLALETALFDTGAPRAARREILSSLTTLGTDEAAALLGACLRQDADVELRSLALEVPGSPADLSALRRAVEWGAPAAREAALRRLAVSPGVESERYLALASLAPRSDR